MNKTTLIFKHEFITLIRRTGFIIMTIAFPLIALIAIAGGEIFSGITGGGEPGPTEEVQIGYVDTIGLIDGHVEQGDFLFVPFDTVEAANRALLDDDISEYIVIDPAYLESGAVVRFTLSRELEPPGDKLAATRNFLLDNLLASDIEPAILDRAKSPLNLVNILIDPETGLPAEDQGGFIAMVLPYFFSILLVMAIFTSSGYLLQGLAEEKENRIMEVLLSSVSARELITGKVLGLGAAGLAQMAIWLLSARFLADLASTNFSDILGALEVSATFVILGLAYFILGYLFYAIIMAAIGSITSTVRESQQLATIFSLLAVSPLWGLVFLIENPHHPVSVFLTLFPFTAPITTIIRIGAADVPLWQIASSMAIMAASIVGLLSLSAKVFRTFLLMYGKTPRLGEIIRLLKQA
jgi:ABC-2 type transport system permease protein